MTSLDSTDIAAVAGRLAAELMPVAVLLAGGDAAALAEALAETGIIAETLGDAPAAGGFDLAILAGPMPPDTLPTRALVQRLGEASDRLLLIPARADTPVQPGAEPDDAAQLAWFELFADFGYQPVIEFDAAFLGRGAFLVDRAAIAAEADLAEFADRVAEGRKPRESEDDPELAGLRAEVRAKTQAASELQARLAAAEGRAALLLGQLDAARDETRRLQEAQQGWEALRAWTRARVRAVVDTPARPPRSWLRRFLARRQPPSPEAAQAAELRASPLFDAAWYIASCPDTALPDATGLPADPVLHYLRIGAARGADPGPWFDGAAYLAAHPELAVTGENPLLHAIRTGAAADISHKGC